MRLVKNSIKKYHNSSGFSMAEVLIVVAVIAILGTMLASGASNLMTATKDIEERNSLNEVEKALKAYSEINYEYPAVGATWAQDLARYTNMSEDEILNSTWNNGREYRVEVTTRTYREGTLSIYYGFVISFGADGCYTDAAEDVHCNAAIDTALDKVFDPTESGAPTENEIVTGYSNLSAIGGSDDQIVKITDYKFKLDLYNVSIERLGKISTALEEYSQVKQFEGIAGGEIDGLIYVPRDISGGSASLYSALVPTSGAESINNSAVAADRKSSMLELIGILGLPVSTCCTPLRRFDDGSGVMQDEAFYYYSNPTPETAPGICGTQPVAADRKSPPKISIDPYICG